LMEAAKDGASDLVRDLIAHQADINAREGDDGLPGTLDVSAGTGMTPLIFAVVGGHVAVVKILLQAGAEVSMRNRGGQDALDVATKIGNPDMITLLRGATMAAGK
jgi:ankyrin repeat protein